MEMDSSSRSPDSSCPDYHSYDASLGHTNRDQSSSSLDIFINSSTANSVSSSFRIQFQNHLGSNGNGQDPENLSRGENYQNNGKSVINFAVGSQWRGSSPTTVNLGGSLPSANYQNSSLSTGIGFDNFLKTTVEQVHTSHNPPSYSKPEMPYFASTSSMPAASRTNPEVVPFPKIEHSHVSASVSSSSSFSAVPPSSTNYVNRARKQITCQIIPEATEIQRSFPQANPKPLDTFWSASNVPQRHVSSYHLNLQQPETSAKSLCVEKGLKRKSSPVLNNSDYLSAPSSSSNCVEKEQSMPHESKKKRVHGSSSYVEVDNIDDDIQIIMPKTSKSQCSASSSSVSTASYHKPSVISDSGSLSSANSSMQTSSEPRHNQLLENRRSHQTTQDSSSTIHNPLSDEELEQMLMDSVWPELNELSSSSSTDITLTATATPGTESEESSSSSIISIHEVLKTTNSFEKSKPSSPILKEVPSDIPALITLDNSPKNDELQELKTKQEVENVKEDFKRLIEDELICNICTEVLIKPITLGCSHTFCKFCISEWKEKKRQCPMCRASIETETPCLFLDNFISKAVEQLDPASVEKRLEIIKCREEEQKKKEYKPPVLPQRPPNVPQYSPFNLYPFDAYRIQSSAPQHSNRISQLSNFRELLEGRTSAMIQRRPIILEQPSNMLQQSLNMLHQSSNVSHQSSNVPHQSSNIPHHSSSVHQISPSLPQISTSIARLSSSITQVPSSVSQRSSIPQQASSLPQRSSNIPPQYSNLLQPNHFYGPTNYEYFYWNK